MKKLSKKEHSHLYWKVQNEGFGYYMMDYGPDLKAIEKLGFKKSEVKKAIELFQEIESTIDEAAEWSDEVDEDFDSADEPDFEDEE